MNGATGVSSAASMPCAEQCWGATSGSSASVTINPALAGKLPVAPEQTLVLTGVARFRVPFSTYRQSSFAGLSRRVSAWHPPENKYNNGLYAAASHMAVTICHITS